MKKLARVLAMMLCLVLLLQGAALADEYKFPNAIWPLLEEIQAAVDRQDDAAIVDFSRQVLEVIQNEPENQMVNELRASRYEQIALALERMGDYGAAAAAFADYLPYAEKMGWEDAVTISSAKIYQYTSDLSLYTPTTEPQVYHNARHEPQTGVYYGIPADSATRAELPGESMMLLYYNLGNETDLSWHRHIIEESADKDLLVEFALNLPGEGSQVAGFASYQKEVQQVIELMASMPNTRFLLRFAAEFNVWSDLPDPAQYISVFRQVATAARRHPNIAMVWSPNDASSWGVNLADYYPGDEYVDWVGVSLYVKKYFQGNPDANDYDEIVFRTGDSANPVKTLEEIVSLYGDRKPIMLSESGASHTCRTAGESTADFALKALPQLYLNLPMVYPQVKLIAHFDKVMPAESEDYALTTSAQVKQLYKELTASPAFIQSNGSAAPVTHQKLTDGYVAAGNTLTVSAYTHLFKADSVTVDYYVDDALLASSSQLPYTVTLDLSGLAAGSHVVKAVATGSTGSVVETSFTMTAGTAAPVEPPAPEPPAAPVFDDVPAGEYFAKPVAWAVENAITQGTGATTFSPADTCTRAQILTFLWRAAGKPVVEDAALVPEGVAASEYYYEALRWGMGNGFFDETGIRPAEDCTRADAVWFIYCAAGKPAVAADALAFDDVAADAAFVPAVAWAVENTVTQGTGATTFSPADTCTRGQIVTFLFRAFGK